MGAGTEKGTGEREVRGKGSIRKETEGSRIVEKDRTGLLFQNCIYEGI
jgi:hypothetical protein